jgi:Spy/CpxP family protein refolding chaperone
MFATKTTAWIGAGLIAGMVAAGPMAMSAEKSGRAWRAKTPLGKLVSGQIGRLMVLRSELDVTQEQRCKIRDILKQHKPEILDAAENVWKHRNALRDAVLAKKPDESKIRKAADKLGKAIGDAAVLGSELAAEVRPILTAEQIERLEEFRDDRQGAVVDFFEKAAAKQ